MLDVLVIAPHPDDAEIGMGGSIARMLAEGFRVGVLDLSDGEPTPHGSRALRQEESAAASRELGVAWRRCLGLPNRSIEHTLEARRALAVVLREARPAILFAPHWDDAHPDHLAATDIVQGARFWAKLTKSDMPGAPHLPRRIYYYFHGVHLRVPERPSFVLDISEHIDAKLRAVACYRSQFTGSGPSQPAPILDDLRARARYWGWAIGTQYAEPFAAREPIGLASLKALL